MDFDWKTAYERLVSKVTDQLDLLEESVLNGEIPSTAVHKIIKKLIQDEQKRSLESSQLQLKAQSKPQAQFPSSAQNDSENSFNSLEDQENGNSVSYSNPFAFEITEVENVDVGNLDLNVDLGDHSQSEKAGAETNINDESTDNRADAISEDSLGPIPNEGEDQQNEERQLKLPLNKKPFKCPKCPYRAKWKTRVKAHLKHVHQLSRPFSCPHPGCNYASNHKSNLTTHLKIHSGEKPEFSCSHPDCNYSTSRKGNLIRHNRVHTGEKPWVCQFESCSYATAYSSLLVDHSRKHTKEQPYKCLEKNCKYSARSYSTLWCHRRSHLKKRKRLPVQKPSSFPCPLCDFVSNIQGNLSQHMKIHSLEKPFACSVESCEYKTKFKSSLSLHLKTHSEERRYKCELCPYRGKTRNVVRIHLTHVHSDPKSWTFKCKEPNCDFVSKTNSKLQRHLLTHSQKKNYACSFPGCEYTARFKQSVKIHESSVHREERKGKCTTVRTNAKQRLHSKST